MSLIKEYLSTQACYFTYENINKPTIVAHIRPDVITEAGHLSQQNYQVTKVLEKFTNSSFGRFLDGHWGIDGCGRNRGLVGDHVQITFTFEPYFFFGESYCRKCHGSKEEDWLGKTKECYECKGTGKEKISNNFSRKIIKSIEILLHHLHFNYFLEIEDASSNDLRMEYLVDGRISDNYFRRLLEFFNQEKSKSIIDAPPEKIELEGPRKSMMELYNHLHTTKENSKNYRETDFETSINNNGGFFVLCDRMTATYVSLSDTGLGRNNNRSMYNHNIDTYSQQIVLFLGVISTYNEVMKATLVEKIK